MYKQATQGPCNIPKPAIWQVINRAKYDAWCALGNMAKTDAMRTYVEELKKVSGSHVHEFLNRLQIKRKILDFADYRDYVHDIRRRLLHESDRHFL